MTADRPSLFCDVTLAARIERVEAQLVAAASRAAHRRAATPGFVVPTGGGVASYADDGSPFNKVDDVPEPVAPPGIEVRRSGDDEFERWLEVAADGVALPDTDGLPAHEDFPRAVYLAAERDMAAAGVERYAAWRDGVLAGGGALRLAEGVAQFAGAATAPEHRRRGIQSALLAARLAEARAAGCDVAVVTTAPASRSQLNVQRCGFDLLYTRAVLVRQP